MPPGQWVHFPVWEPGSFAKIVEATVRGWSGTGTEGVGVVGGLRLVVLWPGGMVNLASIKVNPMLQVDMLSRDMPHDCQVETAGRPNEIVHRLV